MTQTRNWAGNQTFAATHVQRPASLDELQAIVRRAPKIHVLGSGHSFNDIADSAELISLEQLDPHIDIDRSAHAVTVNAGIRYGDLARELERQQLALHNMASLPHISVGGAIATATHGSGDRNGNLATAVSALELITSDGDVVTASRGDDDFDGMVVHLGALGVVTRVTLDVQPSYQVRQEVFEHLDWAVLYAEFDAVMASADSVSLFTDFGDDIAEMWRKSRVHSDDAGDTGQRTAQRFGTQAATQPLHPVRALPADDCTDQLGVPGSWFERLPHFRIEAAMAGGSDLQSEYMVPRRDAVAALDAVRELAPLFRPYLWISEIRSVAADQLWMSTAYGGDTVCLHFTWRFGPDAVMKVLPTIEAALAPFGARPHWGKLFVATAQELEMRYERMSDFRQLAQRMDLRGAFRNAFLSRTVLS